MNEATPPKEERVAALNGLGTSRKRVEDEAKRAQQKFYTQPGQKRSCRRLMEKCGGALAGTRWAPVGWEMIRLVLW